MLNYSSNQGIDKLLGNTVFISIKMLFVHVERFTNFKALHVRNWVCRISNDSHAEITKQGSNVARRTAARRRNATIRHFNTSGMRMLNILLSMSSSVVSIKYSSLTIISA